jgi:serine/threonine protein kinase
MHSDHTQHQSDEEERLARELSLRQTRPPTQVPGYELTQFLGAGAYGEVWIGLDCTTGRRVAVKFYLYRSGVDWTLLSREVEKLVFLSADRYVVQLLDVGWEADPPYFVMEYIENGSLEQLLQREGPRPLEQAVELFREIAIGLNHAHAKGVLHCDLKPGNVLLDQDAHPRLADFGQSRLSHEQTGSLGTLFYMAPEQADLKAVPDARWDVYALGALLHCMLVGSPPYQDDAIVARLESITDLASRLSAYREWIRSQPRPAKHSLVKGVDHALADVVSRCLEVRPEKRFANVQEVLDALRARDQARYRRPLLLLGILGPVLLMLVMSVFGWRGYHRAVEQSDRVVTEKVRESNSFAANFVAAKVAAEIERYFRAVEAATSDPELVRRVDRVDRELHDLLITLSDVNVEEAARQQAREAFLKAEPRRALQRKVDELLTSREGPRVASWFICGARGTHLAGAFQRPGDSTIGDNFAYRTYCHGGLRDLDPSARPLPQQHVEHTHLSAPLRSAVTHTLKIAASRPMFAPDDPDRLLAIVVLTVEVGNFLKFDSSDTRFAVLVDGRDNGFQGVILHHPLYSNVFAQQGRLPPRFSSYRVPLEKALEEGGVYHDPLGDDSAGQRFNCPWIAARADVQMSDAPDREHELRNTGLIVLVQEDKRTAMRPLNQLSSRLAREGGLALITILSVVFLLWYFVLRVLGEPSFRPPHQRMEGLSVTSSGNPRSGVGSSTATRSQEASEERPAS